MVHWYLRFGAIFLHLRFPSRHCTLFGWRGLEAFLLKAPCSIRFGWGAAYVQSKSEPFLDRLSLGSATVPQHSIHQSITEYFPGCPRYRSWGQGGRTGPTLQRPPQRQRENLEPVRALEHPP